MNFRISSFFQSVSQSRSVMRSLRHRNYRLFFFGQGTSLIGTWMQRVALGWLVYRLTGSEALLGIVGFSSQVLTFVGAPFAGVVADRANRHTVLVWTQVVAMFQGLTLAILTLTGTITVTSIILLSLVLGLINAFDVPIRQSFVIQMIDDPKDLPNAIALNSFMFNGTRLIGPTLAGVIIAVAGEGVCFLVNALTFLAVIAALLAMRVKRLQHPPRHSRMLGDIKEGWGYAFRSVPIRNVVVQITLISLLATPYMVLMPVFAKDILHGGPQLLGLLTAGVGAGALFGALFLASRKSVTGLGRVMVVTSWVLGLAIAGFSWSREIWLSLILLAIMGFGIMVQAASSNTLLQTVVDEDKRGRIMSLFAMAFLGVAPFGSLLAGAVAERIGAPWTLTLGGLGCVASGLLFMRHLGPLETLVHSASRRGIFKTEP